MIKIRKPVTMFTSHMILKYNGRNQNFFQRKILSKIKIQEYNYDILEGLVVNYVMFDGTEVLFSLISSNLYLRIQDKFQLMGEQNFCNFELYQHDNLIVFDGFISYVNIINENYNFKEDFNATIIIDNKHMEQILEIWNNKNIV